MLEVSTRSTDVEYRLDGAILLYQGSDNISAYASTHRIMMARKRCVLGPGSPVTVEGLRDLTKALLPDIIAVPELIPAYVLAQGPEFLVWWMPPQSRTVFFKAAELGGERSAKVPLPGLVFAVVAGNWYVFAVKGEHRPDAATLLHRTPFYNVWADGKICTGSVQKPKGTLAQRTELWEAAFFDSWFTHSNMRDREKLVTSKGGATAFWKKMLSGGFEQFPEPALVSLKTTVADVLSGIGHLLRGGDHGRA